MRLHWFYRSFIRMNYCNSTVLETFPLKICIITSLLILYQLKCIQANFDNGKPRHGSYEHSNYGNRGKQHYDDYNPLKTISTAKVQNYTHVQAVEIPYPVRVGQNVQLKCKWKIGVTGFYALRWYKNSEQFYAYLKGENPQIHPSEGINVTMSESDDHVVTLRNVNLQAEGNYRCEVMGEAPRFQISQKNASLKIAVIAETPVISGILQTYHTGDLLNVTCKAANGRPTPKIIIKVDEIEIHNELLKIDLPNVTGDRPGVYTSQSRLVLKLTDKHEPSLKLGCYAYTDGLSVQKEITIYLQRRQQHFLGMFFSNADNKTKMITGFDDQSSVNETDIPNNETDTSNNETDIPNNETDIPNNETDIPNNETDIPNNEADTYNHETDTSNNVADRSFSSHHFVFCLVALSVFVFCLVASSFLLV